MAAPDGGPDPASKYFTDCPQWQLVFCKTCEHAVWPDKIASHLQNKALGYQIKPGVAQAVQAAIQQWPDLIYRATDLAAVPDPPMPAIFGLKIHTNGFRCQIKPGECHFVCLKHETIKSHLSKVHPGSRGRKGTRSLATRDLPAPELYKGIRASQRFFTSKTRSEYFEIEVEVAEPNGRATILSSGAQQVKERLDRRMELVAETERRELGDGEADEVNPWLTRTGWVTYLRDQDRQKLLASVREPDEARDPILATIWKAMDVMFEHCQESVVRRAGVFVRLEAVWTECHQTKYQPLPAYMEASRVWAHGRPWKQVVAFILRTQGEQDWRVPKYRLTSKQKSALAELREAAGKQVEKDSEASSDRGSAASNSSDSGTGGRYPTRLRGLQQAWLRFCLRLLSQKIHRSEYSSPLVCALAVLSKRVAGGLL
ncbi:hypothetical protein MMC34_008357 [Xylographa carneopallida]|nr:hypothetical protein [Xylographa carneopallida]